MMQIYNEFAGIKKTGTKKVIIYLTPKPTSMSTLFQLLQIIPQTIVNNTR